MSVHHTSSGSLQVRDRLESTIMTARICKQPRAGRGETAEGATGVRVDCVVLWSGEAAQLLQCDCSEFWETSIDH